MSDKPNIYHPQSLPRASHQGAIPRASLNRAKIVITVLCSLSAALLEACSDNPNEKILDQAAQCGNIHFPSPPKVVAAHADSTSNGDSSIELVTDLPKTEIDSFKKLSNLPPLSTGIPKDWARDYWQDNGVAEILRSDNPTGLEHVEEKYTNSSHPRWVVIADNGKPDSRVFIRIACY